MRPALRRIAAWVACLVSAAGGACFDFDSTTAGGPLEDGGVDARATPGTDANVADGTLPADASDAGPPLGDDASAHDATSPLDATKTPPADGGFCATLVPPTGGVFFCDDFDEHALPGSWNTWHESSGTLVETEAGSFSPPNSVDEATLPLAFGQTIDVALRTLLSAPAAPPATLRFAFAIDPLQIDPASGAAIVLGAVDLLDSSGDRYSVELSVNVVSGAPALALGEQYGFPDGGLPPDGGPPYINHPLPPTQPLPMNAWTDIVVELDWTAPFTAQGIVTINGGQELAVPLSLNLTPTSLQIGVGTSYVTEYTSGNSPVWELRYDNVWFSAK